MALHDTHAYCGVTVSKGQQKLEGRWVRATAMLSSMSKERVTGRIDDIAVMINVATSIWNSWSDGRV
jgi:hypothetical protein